MVTVHSYILVGRFHARMKICLHECTKGAPFHEQKRAAKQRRALKVRFCEWCGVNSNDPRAHFIFWLQQPHFRVTIRCSITKDKKVKKTGGSIVYEKNKRSHRL